ncbi:MAG: hypothetical protein LBV68_06900 [Spirochaetaceae bacterium]|jgi:hypothetical protein|nr:hypothetical protein [Spirochaetaceae bacterium]
MKRKTRILALVSGLMAVAVMFIGCTVDAHDPAKTGQEQGGQDQTSKKNLIEVPGAHNLAVKFGVIGTEPGAETTKADVKKTLEKIHEYLENYPDAEGIKLGDYIELPELNVSGHPGDEGKIDGLSKAHVLVVGINSFKNPINGTDTASHLVFQFEDALVARTMGVEDTPYSYIGSEMQTYLRKKFVPALGNAGVTSDYLWAPRRAIAAQFNSESPTFIADDTVWLPTEREIFGDRSYSVNAAETTTNQARLEYYATAESRKKGLSATPTTFVKYWLASPAGPPATPDNVGACAVSEDGLATAALVFEVVIVDISFPVEPLGFAPAFCIK